jgi:hypothetical protein
VAVAAAEALDAMVAVLIVHIQIEDSKRVVEGEFYHQERVLVTVSLEPLTFGRPTKL